MPSPPRSLPPITPVVRAPLQEELARLRAYLAALGLPADEMRLENTSEPVAPTYPLGGGSPVYQRPPQRFRLSVHVALEEQTMCEGLERVNAALAPEAEERDWETAGGLG